MPVTISNPIVSIITPSYNQAPFLEQTIRSVLAQDFAMERPGAMEYIIVDGASQDGSLEIIHRYASQLTWWVSEPDSGQAEAINKGFKKAQGEIVAWLNSDDIYLPGAIKSAVAALQSDPALGMVFGDAITIDALGKPLNRLAFGDWGLDELMGFRILCQPAVFIRRAVLEKAGLLDPAYHFMLDHHLWLRIAQLAPVRHVPALWAAARVHPAAKNVSQASGFSFETQRLRDWMDSQAALAPRLAKNRRCIDAGAQRLIARYLLDGGLPGPALRAYGKALLNRPGFALKHGHRMIYALLCLVGAAGVQRWYYRLVGFFPGHRVRLGASPEYKNWPGLQYEESR
jgi:glycosyltransferase involved in cell wall biosynthesis